MSEVADAAPAQMKTCTKCGERKALDAFSRNRRSKGGRDPRCKQCCAEYQRERMADPEKREAKNRRVRERMAADPEKREAKSRRERERRADPAVREALNRRVRERMAAAHTDERARRIFVAKQAWSTSRQRAKRTGVPHTVTRQHIIDLALQTDDCSCCGDRLDWMPKGGPTAADNSPSLDKLIPRLGYTDQTVEFICRRCNAMKSDAESGDELIRIGEHINQRLARAVELLMG
jgi:hypothetical protein